MKTKFFSLLIIFSFLGFSAFSQGFTIGVKAGANLGKMTGQSFKDQYTLGYQVGGFVTIPLGKRFAIQPEVIFNQTNLDTSSKFSDIYAFNNVSKIELRQLSIPIMLNVNLNKYITFQAGPQFGVTLDQSKNLLENGKDAFKSGNFSLAGGIQLNLLKFRVYGRYVGGLTNLDNVGDKENWKVQSIQVGLGIGL
ncbi:MAG: porin family protein [Ginsengibacter sp.]